MAAVGFQGSKAHLVRTALAGGPVTPGQISYFPAIGDMRALSVRQKKSALSSPSCAIFCLTRTTGDSRCGDQHRFLRESPGRSLSARLIRVDMTGRH